jgi:regulator of sirC expression with transglutaminase-like and TPR domain
MSAGAAEPDGARRDERAEHEALLRGVATARDAPIAIAEAALALAALERPHVDLARYRQHLDRLAADTAAVARNDADVAAHAAALTSVLLGSHGYVGDQLNYDDLQNANLIRVMDRRKGLPVALGILYMHAARAQGWSVCGIAFPGHFLLQLADGGERLILDPFHGGIARDAADLRALLKALGGAAAELQPTHYAPVSDRAVLLRLQNNIKLRLLQNRQQERALRIIEGMLLFAPDFAGLWREAGAINAGLGNYRAAIAALEGYLARESDDAARHGAAALLQSYRQRLN